MLPPRHQGRNGAARTPGRQRRAARPGGRRRTGCPEGTERQRRREARAFGRRRPRQRRAKAQAERADPSGSPGTGRRSWPYGRTQAGRSGDPAIRRSGDPAIRRSGDPAIRRSGDPDVLKAGRARQAPKRKIPERAKGLREGVPGHLRHRGRACRNCLADRYPHWLAPVSGEVAVRAPGNSRGHYRSSD